MSTHAGHGRTNYSCGHLASQCRCPHTAADITTLHYPCAGCSNEKPAVAPHEGTTPANEICCGVLAPTSAPTTIDLPICRQCLNRGWYFNGEIRIVCTECDNLVRAGSPREEAAAPTPTNDPEAEAFVRHLSARTRVLVEIQIALKAGCSAGVSTLEHWSHLLLAEMTEDVRSRLPHIASVVRDRPRSRKLSLRSLF